MRRRVINLLGAIALAISMILVIWQGSFTFGEYAPRNIEQTYLFWAISTLIFLLMVMLAFMLFRSAVRLYVERQESGGGGAIKTKIVVGALVLSIMPVFFMVLWSFSVLNRNLDKWFSRPAVDVRTGLVEVAGALQEETRAKATAQAQLLAALPEIRYYLVTGRRDAGYFDALCEVREFDQVYLLRPDRSRLPVCPTPASEGRDSTRSLNVGAPIEIAGERLGELVLVSRMPIDLGTKQREIERHVREYDELATGRKATRRAYLLLLALITVFILFVAVWIALFLARQVNVPITALLEAASEVRRGNLSHRVKVHAVDELGSLVQSFNDMTRDLETSRRELESRQRFIEAILENTPTGVISISSNGRIQIVNRALSRIFSPDRIKVATELRDLFPPEYAGELQYLMNRARRTGVASGQYDFTVEQRSKHLSVTVSALDEGVTSGFVVVLEDTTDLLRAEKAAAWREVARRIAHEMKNPLTPISLCSQRIARQLDKAADSDGRLSEDVARILKECSGTISQEVESVQTLVNEFSQFARFPAAQPEPADLNEVVESGLAVFEGRLEGIQVTKELADDLPAVNLDREQFKRVVVNLVDNSAEAMGDALSKRLYIGTRVAGADTVELVVADTGCGISEEDKERLFLPYFSTKDRGTGLGLAIASHIVSEHGAQIRVEDNFPVGARFTVDIPVPVIPGTREVREVST